MAKAMFYIKNGVQEVGYRLYVMEKILNSNLNGTALNMPDGSVKVLLEGEKEKILEFIEELKKEKPELAENPGITGPEFNEKLIVPDVLRSSQALQMGQFQKSVNYLAGLKGEMGQGFGSLSTEMKQGFGDIGQKLDELPEKITGKITQKLDELPDRIARAIKE